MENTKRFVVTHLDKDGQRVMTGACQYRNTYGTKKSAQDYLDAMKRNNSASTLAMFGNPDLMEVREVECWEMKDGTVGDPKTVYFD